MKLLRQLYLYDEYHFLKSIICPDTVNKMSFSEYIENDNRYTFEEKARCFVKYENRQSDYQFLEDFWNEHRKKCKETSLNEVSGSYTKEQLDILDKLENIHEVKL